MSRFTTDSARKFLRVAGLFFYDDPEEEIAGLKEVYGDKWTPKQEDEWRQELAASPQTLNMNDVWGWACADGYAVPDDQLVECAELAWRYGWAGILYFVSSKQEWCRSEFHDNNRMIDFVKHEEDHRRGKTSSQAAYTPLTYTLGASVRDKPAP